MANVRPRAFFHAIVIVLLACSLGGCAFAAVQAAQAAFAGTMLVGTEDRSPFVTFGPDAGAPADEELASLDAHILRAECGDPASQFWLGSAMRNNFNAAPNRVEIYKWYRLADMGNFEPASEQLTVVAANMSASEIEQGRARAQAFNPRVDGCPPPGA